MFSTLTFLLFLKLVASLDEVHVLTTNSTASEYSFHDVSEIVLCRSCGNDITFSSSLINKESPSSHYSYYDTLFNEDEVLIQMAMSNLFLPYPVITTSHSNCVGVTELLTH